MRFSPPSLSRAGGKRLAGPFEPGLKLRAKLFAVTPDARYLVYGGAWDFSLRIFSLGEKGGKCEKNFGSGSAFLLAKNSDFWWKRCGKNCLEYRQKKKMRKSAWCWRPVTLITKQPFIYNCPLPTPSGTLAVFFNSKAGVRIFQSLRNFGRILNFCVRAVVLAFFFFIMLPFIAIVNRVTYLRV